VAGEPALAQDWKKSEHAKRSRTAAIFLRQARFALALRKLVLEKDIRISTPRIRMRWSARLFAGDVDLTVGATIEQKPELPQKLARSGAAPNVGCVTGWSDRKFFPGAGGIHFSSQGSLFLFQKTLPPCSEKQSGIDLTDQAISAGMVGVADVAGARACWRKTKNKRMKQKSHSARPAARHTAFPLRKSSATASAGSTTSR